MDVALEQVEDLVASHLVLWTAAEQLAITQAFEKVKRKKMSCVCCVSCHMCCLGELHAILSNVFSVPFSIFYCKT